MSEHVILSHVTSLWLGGVTTMLSGLLIYLTSPNQSLLRTPLGRRVRLLGGGLAAAGLAGYFAGLGAPAAVASWGVALMLSLLLAPFLSMLKGRRT